MSTKERARQLAKELQELTHDALMEGRDLTAHEEATVDKIKAEAYTLKEKAEDERLKAQVDELGRIVGPFPGQQSVTPVSNSSKAAGPWAAKVSDFYGQKALI